MSATLLLLLLGMLIAPFKMMTTTMTHGSSRLDNEQQTKLALTRLMNELMGGYLIECSGVPATSPDPDPPPTGTPANSNEIRYYTLRDGGDKIAFSVNAQNQVTRTVYKLSVGTYPGASYIAQTPTVLARGITMLNFQPKYWDFGQSQWSNFQFPVGPASGWLGDVPPQMRYAVPQGSIVQLDALGVDASNNTSFEFVTSFMTRN